MMKCFLKYEGEGMLSMTVLLCIWTWKNEYAPKGWKEGVVQNVFKKETRLTRGTTEGCCS